MADGTTATTAVPHKHEGGFPPFDTTTFPSQIFWLAIWFVLLYLLMAKVGLPRVTVAIEARRQRREEDLARAAALKSEAEAASAYHVLTESLRMLTTGDANIAARQGFEAESTAAGKKVGDAQFLETAEPAGEHRE